ncbi:2-nitropropane dioxygenase [Pelistega indica]|uniref:Nitronate monooxygenase n=1 Tax=Pelistega indica TaxID=1414851 RepID=V8G8W0_9BURK|nr:nitronate monooxygenase [Pelistega indica]ETD72521.1 2-nitropropane dioxygenase [Pelistega indica]
MDIIQAPMAGAQDADLTIAVSKAGGIGSLPAAMLSTEKLATELERINSSLDGQHYNVNFFAHTSPDYSVTQISQWHAFLKPYLEEFGLSTQDIPTGVGRMPFNQEGLALIQEFRPPIVSFHFGLPDDSLLATIKKTGAEIWSSATTVAEAKYLESKGVTRIIAQGLEAGGHRGMFLSQDLSEQLGLFSLLPQIVEAVKCPVIAAGGIADAKGVNAARQLGASAVQVGTAFLLADEAKISAAHKQALQSEQAHHTVITNILSGRYARGIINRIMRENGLIHPDVLPFPGASLAIGMLKAHAEVKHCYDFSSFWAGQSALLAKSGSAAEILQRLKKGDD